MGHWKGAAGELEVAKLIQPWWQRVEPGTIFSRTPGSGGWAKKRIVPPGFKGCGDLMTDRESRFPFSIEVKNRKAVTFQALVGFSNGKDSPICGYWEQCLDSARRDGQLPMLWVKGIRVPWRVVVSNGAEIRMWFSWEFLEFPAERFKI